MEHPANKGLNFTFDGSVSKEVLIRYSKSENVKQ